MTARDAGAVVFDMDGVLVDSGAHHRDAWRAMFRDIGVAPPPEFWRITIGRPADEAVALLVDGIDHAEARRLADVKREHYSRLARRGTVPVAGVGAFVQALAHDEVPRAVATSATRRDLERVLGELGLRSRFGVKPSACVVFEDALVGVQAARAAGMRVIGVTSAHTTDELVGAGAERAVPDFEDVRWPV